MWIKLFHNMYAISDSSTDCFDSELVFSSLYTSMLYSSKIVVVPIVIVIVIVIVSYGVQMIINCIGKIL